mmetsp:Transcript_69271/g.144428  ORF Transcript_69271/g.144428 Transcript_69271/m.144428 type:complete len:231 (+) Transcript_69271:311-1003(+)
MSTGAYLKRSKSAASTPSCPHRNARTTPTHPLSPVSASGCNRTAQPTAIRTPDRVTEVATQPAPAWMPAAKSCTGFRSRCIAEINELREPIDCGIACSSLGSIALGCCAINSTFLFFRVCPAAELFLRIQSSSSSSPSPSPISSVSDAVRSSATASVPTPPLRPYAFAYASASNAASGGGLIRRSVLPSPSQNSACMRCGRSSACISQSIPVTSLPSSSTPDTRARYTVC